MSGRARITDEVWLSGDARVSGEAELTGRASVADGASVTRSEHVQTYVEPESEVLWTAYRSHRDGAKYLKGRTFMEEADAPAELVGLVQAAWQKKKSCRGSSWR